MKLLYKSVIAGILLLTLLGTTDHKFYVSQTDMFFNDQTDTWQVVLHLFIDDLENALREAGAPRLYLCTEKEIEGTDDFLREYLNQKFILSADEKRLDLNFVGKEISDDLSAVYCYLESDSLAKFSTLTIHNTLLLELFDDQKNIIRLQMPNGLEKHAMLHRGNSQAAFEF